MYTSAKRTAKEAVVATTTTMNSALDKVLPSGVAAKVKKGLVKHLVRHSGEKLTYGQVR
jgi:hypothetical protein